MSMSHIVQLLSQRGYDVVDYDERIAQESIAAGTTEKICRVDTKMGKQAFLVAVSNGVQSAAGASSLVFSLVSDDAYIWPYQELQVSLSDVGLLQPLPFPREISQNKTLEWRVENTDGVNAHVATCRLVVYYCVKRGSE